MPEFLNPIQVLNELRLKKDMTAADFGSGSGGWTVPLAKKLEDGIIYAVDVREEPLSALSGRAKLEEVPNIKKIIANVEEKIPEIKDSSCDLVLLTDLLFQVDDRDGVFAETKRVLKSGGKALVVDWQPGAKLGPKDGKVSPEQVKETARTFGLRFEKQLPAGDYHYALLFSKP